MVVKNIQASGYNGARTVLIFKGGRCVKQQEFGCVLRIKITVSIVLQLCCYGTIS